MITLLVASAIAAGLTGAGVGYGVMRLRARSRARAQAAPAPSPPARTRSAGLSPGDVVAYEGEDWVLERGSELVDGAFLRVFEALSAEPRYVLQLDAEAERLVLARPYAELPEGRVADLVTVGVRSLELVARGAAEARDVAEALGLVSGRCAFTILADRAGRTLVVIEPASGARLALLGDRLDPRRVDVLLGG